MKKNKKRKLTKSESLELTKTLVLNFNELERIANYEKKTSKKPAIMFALIGLFAIASGLFYPTVNSFMNNRNTKNTRQFRKVEKVVNKYKKMTCTKTAVAIDNQTTAKNTIIFKLKDNSLVSYENYYNEVPNSNDITQTPSSITNLYNYMMPLTSIKIDGYKLIQNYKTDKSNPNIINDYSLKLSVDLEKLDITKLTDAHKTNGYLNVIYTYGDNSTNIKQKLMTEGYTCN